MDNAAKYPFACAAVNFSEDANIAYLARSLACFGGDSVHVIGRIPDNKELIKYSGSMSRHVKFYQHRTPIDFIDYCRANDWQMVSVELTDKAINLNEAKFLYDFKYMFILGNESDGVPTEILTACDWSVYIEMPGFGYCLNTSQAGNIIFYEYSRQVPLMNGFEVETNND